MGDRRLSTAVLLLMSVTAGLCSGSNYFNQPLLDSISAAFRVPGSVASTTVTVAQLSYALGLVFIVPSGDLVRRRRLVLILLCCTAAGLGVSGFAVGMPMFVAGLALSGVAAVAAQVLVAFAATLADPGRRAATTGTVMSGILIGILVARSVSGLLSGLAGWQTVYRVAAVAIVLAALAIRRFLPEEIPSADRPGYGAALRSMPPLLMRFPRLATRTVLGGLTFAGASLVFSTMALHLSAAPFRLDDVQIGLVGLVGVAGALTANFVGIGVDRGADVLMGGASLVSLLLAWGVFAWIGRTSLVAFIMGMVLLDLGLQGIHVANQGIIQRLDDAARSRITSIYMTGYFLGAAAGSAAGALVWGLGQWAAVCLAGVAFLTLAAGAWVVDLRAAADRARPTSHHSLEAQ